MPKDRFCTETYKSTSLTVWKKVISLSEQESLSMDRIGRGTQTDVNSLLTLILFWALDQWFGTTIRPGKVYFGCDHVLKSWEILYLTCIRNSGKNKKYIKQERSCPWDSVMVEIL